jgi:ankyrin repeat domain-containing protein 50
MLMLTCCSFSWLTCQLDALKRCVTPAAVRVRLQNLPPTLEAHYDRELDRLQAAYGQSARSVCRWIATSFRPVLTSLSTIHAQTLTVYRS